MPCFLGVFARFGPNPSEPMGISAGSPVGHPSGGQGRTLPGPPRTRLAPPSPLEGPTPPRPTTGLPPSPIGASRAAQTPAAALLGATLRGVSTEGARHPPILSSLTDTLRHTRSRQAVAYRPRQSRGLTVALRLTAACLSPLMVKRLTFWGRQAACLSGCYLRGDTPHLHWTEGVGWSQDRSTPPPCRAPN